jgi:hypothetical protein
LSASLYNSFNRRIGLGYLEFVLDKVRQSDIENFRTKVETMEKVTDDAVHSQGLEHIDDIAKRRGDKFLEASSLADDNTRYDKQEEARTARLLGEDTPINDKPAQTENKSGEEVFSKFLQSIRG